VHPQASSAGLAEVWREQMQRAYWRSLDHQAIATKQTDKKLFVAKNIAELELSLVFKRGPATLATSLCILKLRLQVLLNVLRSFWTLSTCFSCTWTATLMASALILSDS
jgi:histone deacetylase complex regulatory component SIN3